MDVIGPFRSKAGITHNEYFDGLVQSLAALAGDHDFSVGIVMPGKHEFDPPERRERIVVLVGHLVINGRYVNGSIMSKPVIIEKDEPILVETTEVAAYICWYD